MTGVETRPDVEIEELFATDIPCADCGKSARLRSFGHEGCTHTPPFYRCVACWQKWLTYHLAIFSANGGCIICRGVWGVAGNRGCGQMFYSLQEFSDYREF